MFLSLKCAAAAACCIMMAASGCNEKPALSLSEKDNGAAFETEKGKLIEVRLAGNMGTGYSWQWLNDSNEDAVFAQEGNPKVIPISSGREHLTGGPDETVFLLRVKESGKAKLRFVYIRIWEKNKEPAKEFSADVSVK